MQNLYQKIQKIESLQAAADRATAAFKKRYNVDCLQHCAECCKYNDINASPLEFLPMAWHLYKTGQLEDFFEKISKTDSKQCIFSVFKDDRWGCTCYPSRGMICRLFGFACTKNKLGKPAFAACHTLKHSFPDKINTICQKVTISKRVPVIADFYQKLSMLDLNLGEELIPINQAIKEACEIVYMHTAYK